MRTITLVENEISIAMETSCRAGGVALGRGGELLGVRSLGPSGRHARDLLPELDALLRAEGLRATDVRQVYISVGPGSFTGLRVGITSARTLGQMIEGLRIVAVPTAWAVAENLRQDEWQHLAVLLAAKENAAHVTLFHKNRQKSGDAIEPVEEPCLVTPAEVLANAPRPLLLTGEALEFLDADWPADVRLADPALRLPTAEGIWRVGRQLADCGQFTPWNELLPLYARRPEAVRLWEKKEKRKAES